MFSILYIVNDRQIGNDDGREIHNQSLKINRINRRRYLLKKKANFCTACWCLWHKNFRLRLRIMEYRYFVCVCVCVCEWVWEGVCVCVTWQNHGFLNATPLSLFLSLSFFPPWKNCTLRGGFGRLEIPSCQ